ncbi:MAG: T9SS type A sorting domain-containing protein, partial [Ignavibacteriales bacterium]|nr:T9SS type A sorting domain-containing protein [Ignavibacteriales bacterium]
SATIDERYRLSPPAGLRASRLHGAPFPVPMYIRSSTGSYAMPSQTVPPPPTIHHSPVHVSAARRIASRTTVKYEASTGMRAASCVGSGAVPAAVRSPCATRGTSTSPRDYSYVDANLPSGRYGYRIKQVDFDGTSTYYGNAEVEITAAKAFALEPNYPNPFNPSTTIQFTVGTHGRASLQVYDVLGQRVATLFDNDAEPGRLYQVKFDASHLPSGVYFARLDARQTDGGQAGKQQTMRKMLLVK